jgi:hypothetical protein
MSEANQPAAINLERIAIRIPALSEAWTRKTDAAESYADAVKATAEECGIEPAALKAYINAKMRDKQAKHMRAAEQLSLLFEEIGA